MIYTAITTRVREKLAEYHARAGAAQAQSAYTDTTILNRIGDMERELADIIAQRDPSKIAALATITYAANSEYVDISSAPGVASVSLFMRRILDVIRLIGTSRIPLMRLSPDQYRRMADSGDETEIVRGTGARHGYFIEGKYLYVLPRPTETLSLRARYIPAITAPSGANSPEFIPEEFHHLLACKTALSFAGEGRETRELQREVADGMQRFYPWATKSLTGQGQVRTVREVM